MSIIQLKEKPFCYFIATEEGEMPSIPFRKVEPLYVGLENCKKGWPNKNWKIFEIYQPACRKGEPLPRLQVRGLSEVQSEIMIDILEARHPKKFKDFLKSFYDGKQLHLRISEGKSNVR